MTSKATNAELKRVERNYTNYAKGYSCDAEMNVTFNNADMMQSEYDNYFRAQRFKQRAISIALICALLAIIIAIIFESARFDIPWIAGAVIVCVLAQIIWQQIIKALEY